MIIFPKLKNFGRIQRNNPAPETAIWDHPPQFSVRPGKKYPAAGRLPRIDALSFLLFGIHGYAADSGLRFLFDEGCRFGGAMPVGRHKSALLIECCYHLLVRVNPGGLIVPEF